jgi:hypothetical protein
VRVRQTLRGALALDGCHWLGSGVERLVALIELMKGSALGVWFERQRRPVYLHSTGGFCTTF